MSSRLLRWALAVVVASFGIKVFAHARLKTSGALVPRSTDPGIKAGPCGGVARLAAPAVYAPGTTITVNWEETINHPGRFEFYFSQAGDANFGTPIAVRNKLAAENAAIVGTNYRQYSASITLPNVTCTDCTLQMIQVMTETNPPSLYYACADVRLQAGAPMPAPAPVPNPAPAPAPAPGPGCH